VFTPRFSIQGMPGQRGEVISLPTVGGVPASALRSFCRVSWQTKSKLYPIGVEKSTSRKKGTKKSP
jgi:hypothetical protein